VFTTRGFSKCNGIEVIGLAIATAAGAASLLGITALIIGALILLIILATFVLSSTATSRRETDHARTRPPYPIALAEAASRPRTR
jgi:heme/copper-type cytochrome/quinol oxidase subunit 2